MNADIKVSLILTELSLTPYTLWGTQVLCTIKQYHDVDISKHNRLSPLHLRYVDIWYHLNNAEEYDAALQLRDVALGLRHLRSGPAIPRQQCSSSATSCWRVTPVCALSKTPS